MVLSGKVALLAGGTKGVNASIAMLFRDAGAAVIVTDHSPDSVGAARKIMPGINFADLDTRDTVAMLRLMEDIERKHGRIDVLLLAPDTGEWAPIDLVDEDFFDRQFDVNVRGVYFTLKTTLRLMDQGASIIFVWPRDVTRHASGSSVYAAARSAVRSFAHYLASELAPRRIRVNSICAPSSTVAAGMSLPPSPQENATDEVASAALFLASDASWYVTGAELPIGGSLLRSPVG